MDALADVHGKSCNFLFIHPRQVLLVGCWLTTLPLFSCGIIFISPPMEIGLHGVGLVHLSHPWQMPIHKGMPTSDVTRRIWFQWRTHDFPCLVCHFIRWDVSCNLMDNLPYLFFPPILDLPLSLKTICLHWYQVTRFKVHCAYFSVIVPFLSACFCHQLGLCLP